ncbi:MAG: oxidoreductase [Candidatus Sericytochromatia bacterium]|nr:oxidoreductase [Candidatus Sericytochromatia bacterium]
MTLALPPLPPAIRNWLLAEIPELDGRVALVTGANSGIGLEAARLLAMRGVRVWMACRSAERGEQALAAIRAVVPEAHIDLIPLDLASLGSVRAAAETLAEELGSLDLLINNAGVMALPRGVTAEGHELQFGTNHLGHFALTALLWPLLTAAPAARVVNVSSMVHRMGKIAFEDLMGVRRYDKWGAYAQSKLANLLFTLSLTERRRRHEFPVVPVACHPGYAATNLQSGGPKAAGSGLGEAMANLGNRVFAQSPLMGALPTVKAAAGGGILPGDYIGPAMGGLRGFPRKEQPAPHAQDAKAAERLWQESERLVGFVFDGQKGADPGVSQVAIGAGGTPPDPAEA